LFMPETFLIALFHQNRHVFTRFLSIQAIL
jgi:hypothetical protein